MKNMAKSRFAGSSRADGSIYGGGPAPEPEKCRDLSTQPIHFQPGTPPSQIDGMWNRKVGKRILSAFIFV